MTDLPDKKTSPPDTEPTPAADSVPATDAALTQPLDTADATPTARLDYESPTVPLAPVNGEAPPPSAAFARARWAGGNGSSGSPPTPPAQDSAVPPAPVGPRDVGANPAPLPRSAPAAVPSPPPRAVGAGAAPAGSPTVRARPPMTRTPASAPRRKPPRRRPRFGTILWGVLLLGFAAFMLARTLLPTPPDPTFWLLSGVILVGLLLVVAGLAAASRRAG